MDECVICRRVMCVCDMTKEGGEAEGGAMGDLYSIIDDLYNRVGHRGAGPKPIDYTEKLALVSSAVESMEYLLEESLVDGSRC